MADSSQISACGLYCGNCGKLKKGKCPGCADNEKATWCKLRTCAIQNEFKSCADCSKYSNVKDCKYFDNMIANLFGFIFNSDRAKGIEFIRKNGYEAFALEMEKQNRMAFKR